MALTQKQKQFVDKAYQAGKNIGLSDTAARLAASQAALESSYGTKGKGE